jgi:hypothetical protein
VTPEKARELLLDLYKDGRINASWVADRLSGTPSRATVHRWLASKTTPDPHRWVEMYSIVSAGPGGAADFSEMAMDLALEVLARGASDEAKHLAETIIREQRRTYGS